MNDEQVAREIEEIERELMINDPAFVHRVRHMQRLEAVHDVAVFALLAAGAVLLTIGVATYEVIAWTVGAAAFALAVIVDEVHTRKKR